MSRRSEKGTRRRLLREITEFYSSRKNAKMALEAGNEQILRLLDWVVTRGARRYKFRSKSMMGEVVSVSDAYKAELRRVGKQFLDAFCRVKAKDDVVVLRVPHRSQGQERDDDPDLLDLDRPENADESAQNAQEGEGGADEFPSTVGQLHFLKWAQNLGIVAYVIKNRDRLESIRASDDVRRTHNAIREKVARAQRPPSLMAFFQSPGIPYF